MSHPGLRSTASRPGRPSKGSLTSARPLSDLVSKYETLSTGEKRPTLPSEVKLRPTNRRGSGPPRHQNAVSLYPKSTGVAQTARAETTKTLRQVSSQEKKTQPRIMSTDAAFHLRSPIKDATPEISRTPAAPKSVSERRKAFEALGGISHPGSDQSRTTYREPETIGSPQRTSARQTAPIKTYKETSIYDYPEELSKISVDESKRDKNTTAEAVKHPSPGTNVDSISMAEEMTVPHSPEPGKDIIENPCTNRALILIQGKEEEQPLPVEPSQSPDNKIQSWPQPMPASKTESELISDVESSLNTPIFSEAEIEVLFSKLSTDNSLFSLKGPGSLHIEEPSKTVTAAPTVEIICRQGCCSISQRKRRSLISVSGLLAWQENSTCMLSPAERARSELEHNSANPRKENLANVDSVNGQRIISKTKLLTEESSGIQAIRTAQSNGTPDKSGSVQDGKHVANGKQGLMDSTMKKLRGSLRGWSDSWKSKTAPAQLNTPTTRHASWCPLVMKDQPAPPGVVPVPQTDGNFEPLKDIDMEIQKNSIWRPSRNLADRWQRITPPKDIGDFENGYTTPLRKTLRITPRPLQLSNLFSVKRLSRGSDSSTLIGNEEIGLFEGRERDRNHERPCTSRFREPALYM